MVDDVEQARQRPLVHGTAALRVGRSQYTVVERRARVVVECGDHHGHPGRVARFECAEVACAGDADQLLPPGEREVGVEQRERADQTVLIEVVVGDCLDAVEQLRLLECTERDLRGQVLAERGWGGGAWPVRQGEDGVGVGCAVDHHVGDAGDGVFGHEAQAVHGRHRRAPG